MMVLPAQEVSMEYSNHDYFLRKIYKLQIYQTISVCIQELLLGASLY